MDKVKVTQEELKKVTVETLNNFVGSLVKKADPIIDILLKKNSDYGDAWQRYDIFTPLIRLNDKLLRVENLSSGKTALVPDESVADTLVDIVGYGLLALLKIKHNPKPCKESHIVETEQRIIDLPDVDEEAFEPSQEDLDWIAELEEAQEHEG